MFLTRILVVLCFVVAAAEARPIVGGNPGVALYDGGPDDSASQPDIAIAPDGTQFVVFNLLLDDGPARQIVVLRSTDGGTTWSTWASFSGASGIFLSDPRIGIIGTGTVDEHVVITYRSQLAGVENRLYAAFADPTDAVPGWDVRVVFDVPSTFYPSIQDYDVAFGADGETSVACAIAMEVAENVFEWHYDVRETLADDFDAESVVHTVTLDPEISFPGANVALDFHDRSGDDRVHVMMSVSAGFVDEPDFTDVYQAGADGKGVLGAWDPAVLLATRSFQGREIDFAADPEGDTFAVVLEPYEGLVSTNAGAAWSPLVLDDAAEADIDDASLQHVATGIALVGTERSAGTTVGVEYRPVAAVTGPWTGRVLLPAMDGISSPRVADDPSRPGETAFVAQGKLLETRLRSQTIWFNGTWRDDPGYGVAENPVPWTAFGSYITPPTIGDLDGDGQREIVVADFRESFTVFPAISYLRVYPSSEAAGEENLVQTDRLGPSSVAALADVDDDGDLEIFVGGDAGVVLGYDHTLAPLDGWPVSLPTSSPIHVSVGPVTNFMPSEIVAAGANAVVLLGRNGTPRPGAWPFVAPSGTVVGRAALGDVDDDGSVEIVAAFTSGVLILDADGSTQQLLVMPAAPSTGVTLGDLDDDGDLEILVPLENGVVAVVHHDGTSIGPAFPFATGIAAPVSAVVWAELLAPGAPALAFTVDRQVFAIELDGTALPGYPLQPVGVGTGLSGPIVARVADPVTPRPQILVSDTSGRLHMSTATGDVPLDWPHRYADGPLFEPAVSDLDGDGVAEMVIAGGKLMYVLDMGTTGLGGVTRRWSQVGFDRGKTGCAGCVPRNPTSIEPIVDPTTSSLVEFRGGFPNPAADATALAFSLARRTNVRLQVFDVRGRLVQTLADRAFDGGAHTILWNARGRGGQPVASGVYRARLVVGEGSAATTAARAISIVR